MLMLLILVLAGIACLAVAVVALVAVVIAVQHEDRRKSLKAGPATRLEVLTRRFLGVGVRQPEDSTRTISAGRR